MRTSSLKMLTGVLLAGTICLGLPVSAQAADGNWSRAPGDPGDWMDDANWLNGVLPSGGGKAYIRNGGTAFLSDAAPDIGQFDIESGSIVEIRPNARLTGSGNWKIGDNGVLGLTGTLIQTGGMLFTSGDVYLADDDDDWGEYYISAGSMEIGDDLKLGDDGKGLMVLSGTGLVTIHGYVAITNKSAPSVGTFEISGGFLNQVGDRTAAGSGDNDDRFTVADEGPAMLRIIGGEATINVSNFEQRAQGTFEAIMNGTGISTINCVGVGGGASYMDLAGDLVISFAAGDPPPPGSYDLIVADSRTGTFDSITSDEPLVSWAYEDGSAKFTIQVVPEPATMGLLALGGLAFIRRRRKSVS